MSDENGSARDTLVEAISWAEDIDTGRWGYERAAAMLDGYVERIVAERLAAQRLPAATRLIDGVFEATEWYCDDEHDWSGRERLQGRLHAAFAHAYPPGSSRPDGDR